MVTPTNGTSCRILSESQIFEISLLGPNVKTLTFCFFHVKIINVAHFYSLIVCDIICKKTTFTSFPLSFHNLQFKIILFY